MEEDSTTPADNSSDTGSSGNDESQGTDSQTPNNGDNLDTSSSSATADDDNSDADSGDTPPQFDDDLDDWATKTNRKVPESDTERSLLQEIRDGQREYSRSQQSKESQKDVDAALRDAQPDPVDDDDEEDPLEKEVRELRQGLNQEKDRRIRSEFFTTNQITVDEGKVIAEILKDKIERASDKQRAFDFWSSTDQLQDLYDLAKARLSSSDTNEIEAEAARKERERIAKESNATGPARNASAIKTSDKTEDEQRLERFSSWD